MRKSKAENLKFEKKKQKKTINFIMFDMIVYDCQQNVFFCKRFMNNKMFSQTDTCLQFKEVTKTIKIKFVFRHP